MTYVVFVIDVHFYYRIYEAGSENSAAVVAVETHTIHKIEEGIGKSFCHNHHSSSSRGSSAFC